MRFGVCTGLENAELLASVGFDYVEIHACNMMALDEAAFTAFCAENEGAPIHAEAANCLFPGEMALTGPDVQPEKIRDYIRKVMERLGKLGVSSLVFGGGGCRRVPQGYSMEDAWRQLVELGRALGSEAEPWGVTVVLEPLRLAETNIVNTVAEARWLVDEVSHPNFQMLCDMYHFHQVGDDLRELEACGGRLRHIHIAKPDDRRIMYPGDGMNYADFFRTLRATGYDGRVSFEGTILDMSAEMPLTLAVLKSL